MTLYINRVGQNRIHTPYMTVYLVISLPKILYIHRIYMVLANPTHKLMCEEQHMHNERVWNNKHGLRFITLLLRALLLDEF